ncbi:hypothetical protein KI387_038067, partial [Taxus chinensis]
GFLDEPIQYMREDTNVDTLREAVARPAVIDELLGDTGPNKEGVIMPINDTGITPEYTAWWASHLRSFDRVR